ncbi:MAG: TIGR03790 family protein [Planctomycetota bacterium]
MSHHTARLLRIVPALLILLMTTLPGVCLAGGGPQNVLVIINTKSADSIEVGEYYVRQRDIPAINVLRLACPTDLHISFAVAKSKILDPIRRYLDKAGIRDHIHFIVTTQGMPMRVEVGGPGGFNSLSLQALIQVMDTSLPGQPQTKLPAIQNPYFQSGKPFRHETPWGKDNWKMYVVASLQAWTVEDCKALVDRSLASDAGPKGKLFIFQDASANASGRNAQYPQGMDSLKRRGFDVIHCESGGDKVVNQKGIMGYMCGGCYSHLTEDNLKTNEFMPGAMVDALQSFGAVPNNFDLNQGKSQFPITYFIKHGCTVVYGAVAEPYTSAFAPATLFVPYVMGFNAGESMYMMFPLAYWMNMMVGDPLCQPYAVRPALALTNGDALEQPVKDECNVEFASAGELKAQIIEVYLDGIRTHVLPGDATRATLDTRTLKNGSHEVRVVAIGEGDVEAQTCVKAYIEVANTSLFVCSVAPADGSVSVARHERLRVEFNRDLKSDETGKVKIKVAADGTAVPGAWSFDAASGLATFEPAGESGELPPAADIRISVLGTDGKELNSTTFHTAIAALSLTGPATVTAGQAVTLNVMALKTGGAADAKYCGRVSAAFGDTAAEGEANKEFSSGDAGKWAAKVEFRTAGEHVVKVRDAESGAEATLTVTVKPGPLAGVSVNAPDMWPLGAPLSVVLRAGDRFGNVIDSATWEGSVVLTDPNGVLYSRSPAKIDPGTGEVLVRDLDVPKVGNWIVSLDPKAASDAKVFVEDRGVPHCLVVGPFAEKDAAKRMATEYIDERKVEGVPGSVEDQSRLVWRRAEKGSGQTAFDFRAVFAGKPIVNCSAYAMVYLDAVKAMSADLKFSADDGAKVWLNGKQVFEQDGISGQEQRVNGLRLKSGANVLMFKVTQASGGWSLAFSLIDAGKPLEGVVYRVAPRGEPVVCMLSGSVCIGKDAVADASLQLQRIENGQPTGAARRAKTGPNGLFVFDNLARGRYEVTCNVDGASPGSRIVQVIGDHVVDVDFQAPDTIAPAVHIDTLAEKLVADTDIDAIATDNAGIKQVQFLLDGKPFGQPVTDAPFSVSVGPGSLKPGKYKLSAIATDLSGNTATASDVRFEVVVDTRGPRITYRLPRKWEGSVSVNVKAADDVAVATIEVFVDGKSVFRTDKAEGDATIDCAALGAGAHELVVESKDTAGNASRKRKSFRIR